VGARDPPAPVLVTVTMKELCGCVACVDCRDRMDKTEARSHSFTAGPRSAFASKNTDK